VRSSDFSLFTITYRRATPNKLSFFFHRRPFPRTPPPDPIVALPSLSWHTPHFPRLATPKSRASRAALRFLVVCAGFLEQRKGGRRKKPVVRVVDRSVNPNRQE